MVRDTPHPAASPPPLDTFATVLAGSDPTAGLPSPTSDVVPSTLNADAAPVPPGGGRPSTRTHLVASLAFVAMAALDTFEPTTLITGAWWLVLLGVWLMPWPIVDARREQQPWLTQLASLAVFSWLFVRALTGILEAIGTWTLFAPDDALHKFSYPLQSVAAGWVNTLLLATPLRRVFGRDAVRAAFVVATPWIIVTCSDTAFDLVRWSDKPTGNSIFLFEALFPTLLLMQASVVLERRRHGARPRLSTHRPLGDRLDGLFDRIPHWFARSAVAPLLVVTAFAAALRAWLDGSDDLSPALAATVALAVPLCTLLVTAAAIHAFRKRRDARLLRPWCMRTRADRFRNPLDALLSAIVLAPLWLWTLLMDAPLAEEYAKDAIAALPGPAWSIEHDARRQVLTLSGEYQFGVAAAFAAAIEQHPDLRTVELDGPGGRLGEGLAIAHAIEARNLATHAMADCESACTLAFLAGRERTLARDARLGFHSSWSAVALYDGDDSDIVAHLQQRGVAPAFIRRADAVPASDMWYPTRDELLAAHVVTSIP